MPTESQTLVAHYPTGSALYESYAYNHSWERSPRGPDGKLVLVSNPWSLSVMTCRCTNGAQYYAPIIYPTFLSTTNDHRIASARAIAESDLRGELARRIKNNESGSLGVSIASVGQSIQMLRGSATELIKIFSAAERFYRTSRGRRRAARFRRLVSRGAEPTAGMVLAGFFGWAPLFSDFAAACKTVANPWPNSSHISVRKQWRVGPVQNHLTFPDGNRRLASSWSASGHSTYSCSVAVSNPNLWLGNKLGLINPISVAWDLVPWSFLVNMVSNMGQVMGSLTDFTGLSLSNTSLTTGMFLSETTSSYYQDSRPQSASWASGSMNWKIRGRIVGVEPPLVTPYLRFPSWNVGTAAITGSLLIQQNSRLTRLIS